MFRSTLYFHHSHLTSNEDELLVSVTTLYLNLFYPVLTSFVTNEVKPLYRLFPGHWDLGNLTKYVWILLWQPVGKTFFLLSLHPSTHWLYRSLNLLYLYWVRITEEIIMSPILWIHRFLYSADSHIGKVIRQVSKIK